MSKVKRNCVRVTERGEEAWSVNREPMNKNRIEGVAQQGEWAHDHEALVTKARRRRCGGCAMKVCVLTWGYLALRLTPFKVFGKGTSKNPHPPSETAPAHATITP